jgi:hypothetical protein
MADYTIPSMQFHHQGNLITLHGSINSLPTPATFHQLQRMIQTNAVATYHSVTMLSPEQHTNLHDSLHPDNPLLKDLHPDLTQILQHYAQIFSIPNELPPNRNHDHHIHLLPNSTPINLKPYRYPHFQKEAMAKIIAEMLEA